MGSVRNLVQQYEKRSASKDGSAQQSAAVRKEARSEPLAAQSKVASPEARSEPAPGSSAAAPAARAPDDSPESVARTEPKRVGADAPTYNVSVDSGDDASSPEGVPLVVRREMQTLVPAPIHLRTAAAPAQPPPPTQPRRFGSIAEVMMAVLDGCLAHLLQTTQQQTFSQTSFNWQGYENRKGSWPSRCPFQFPGGGAVEFARLDFFRGEASQDRGNWDHARMFQSLESIRKWPPMKDYVQWSSAGTQGNVLLSWPLHL